MNEPKRYTSRSRDPVLSLLYSLMRDHVPVGEMERLVKEIEEQDGLDTVFTNGHLAEYAKEILNRLWRNKQVKEAVTHKQVEPKP